jgi:hypothetical protein
VTVFCPIVNDEPAAGVQVVVTGDFPSATVGQKATVTALPSTDCALCEAGQVIFGGSGVGATGGATGVGVVEPAQAACVIAPATARTRRKPHLYTSRH